MGQQQDAIKPERTVEIARPVRRERDSLGALRRRRVAAAARRWASGRLNSEAILRAAAEAWLRDLE